MDDKLNPRQLCACHSQMHLLMDDTLASSVADFVRCNIRLKPEVPWVYKGIFLLSPLWQTPLWHQVAYATAILSGMNSQCGALQVSQKVCISQAWWR